MAPQNSQFNPNAPYASASTTGAFNPDAPYQSANQNPPSSGSSIQSQPLTGPNGPTTLKAYDPSLWERFTNMFTEGNPNYSSRTVYNPKYGQNQLISPEESMTPVQQRNHPIATGLGEVVGGLTTPQSTAMLAGLGGLGALPKVLTSLVSAGFSLSMLSNAYKTYPEVKAAADRGDSSEVLRLMTHVAGDVALGYLTGRHAIGEAYGAGMDTAGPSVPEQSNVLAGQISKYGVAPSETYSPSEPSVEIAPNPDLKKGQGTSAAFLTEAPPRTNPSQDIQNHSAEVQRLQSIINNPSALPEEKAYAQNALATTYIQRAELQQPSVAGGVEGPTQGGILPATELAGGMEEEDIPYRPPAGANVTPGIYDTQSETSIPLFRETGSAEKSIANVGWYGKGLEGEMGNVPSLSPAQERRFSNQSNEVFNQQGVPLRSRNSQELLYQNNPPLLDTTGALPFNDAQYNIKGTEFAKRVSPGGSGPDTYDQPAFNQDAFLYGQGKEPRPSAIDQETTRFMSGKGLPNRYVGEGTLRRGPFGIKGSYGDQAYLNPALRRMDRAGFQQSEATTNALNELYAILEPHLNQAEKEVYDGIVSNKSRLEITQKTGLTTQQQRTIEANIVAKGKQFISSDFDINPQDGPRATQLAGGMPQVNPSDVLRTAIGAHKYPAIPDVDTPKGMENPSSQERLRVHESVLNNVASPDRINSPEDVRKVTQETAKFMSGKADSRITQPLTLPLRRQLARELGLTEEQFLNTPIGQAVSPEQIEAGRMILDASRDRLMDAMQNAKDDPSKTDTALEALAKHQMIKQVFEQRVAKEAGRSLQAVNDAARGGDAQGRATLDDIAESLSKMSDSAKREAIRRFNLLDKNNPAAIEKFARDIKPSSTWDQLHEAWISALVSGAASVAKFGSDFAMEAATIPTKVLAGAADYIRSTATGTPRERYASEGLTVISSKMRSLDEAGRAFLRGWREEIDPNGNEYGRKTLAIKGTKGQIIRIPLRLLSAVTEANHVLNYATGIDTQAIRQAITENLALPEYDPIETIKRAVEIRQNPTDEMKTEAHRFARTQTFQGDFSGPGWYNAAVRWVQSGRESVPGGRWAAPFVTTPANLLRESARYSPLGFVGSIKGAITGDLPSGELSDVLGKNIVGTALWATALHYALAGRLTGAGPSDYKKLAALKSTGWQPYSYRTSKGTYISYSRLAPVSVALGLAANLVESLREPNKKTNVGEKFVTGLVKTGSLAKDINFLSGMSDVVNDIEGAFEGTESKKTALGGIAASELVPGVVRDTAHIVDSTVRKPTSVREQFETQIPGLSTRVPAKTDISGKPIQRDVRNLGGFNPYTVSQETTDETTKEQARLAQLPPKPSRLELAGIASATPREQTQLNAQEALMLHDRIAELQKQGVLNGISDDNKQRLISRVKSVIAKSRNARLLELRKQSSGPRFNPAQSYTSNSQSGFDPNQPYQ